MARQIKVNLDYFSLDCNIFSKQAELRPLLRRFKSDGLAVFIHILCDVYSTGYYYKPDDFDDYCYDIAEDCGITAEKVQLIIAFMKDRTLLDAFSLDKNTVFTSHGMQKRYAQAMKGRKRSVAELKGEYWILTEEEETEIDTFYKAHPFENKSEKNSNKSEKNDNKSERNATKKIKENKRKEKEIKEEISVQACEEVLSSFKALGCIVDCEVSPNIDLSALFKKIKVTPYLQEWKFLSKYIAKADKILAGYYDSYRVGQKEKKDDFITHQYTEEQYKSVYVDFDNWEGK